MRIYLKSNERTGQALRQRSGQALRQRSGQALRQRSGQAAIELAVFGAIIVFLIGSIVRTAVSNSYQQNQALKAMRLALLKSYQTSRLGQAGHNSTSILYIEDRLSPDAGKYGATDRVPFIMQGSGTMSNMLMYPMDFMDRQMEANTPVLDVFINGKHFTFSTARAIEGKELFPPNENCGAPDPSSCPLYLESYANPPDPRGDGTYRFRSWDFKCLSVTTSGTTIWYGCPLFYTVQARTSATQDKGILSDAESCDLNRNDDFADDPPLWLTGDTTRACSQMAWYWKGVRAMAKNPAIVIDKQNDIYPSFDVDNDGQEESVYDVFYSAGALVKPAGNVNGRVHGANYAPGRITQVNVVDGQEGDLDMAHDKFTLGRRPGLQPDMAIYTQTKDGTYLQIKDGKTYNPANGALIQTSVSSRNQVEIIERVFQLSNDTGRFCDKDGRLTAGTSVEACNDCFSNDHIKLTCYDNQNHDPVTHKIAPRLFVRSRILDKSGHFWKTDLNVYGGLPGHDWQTDKDAYGELP